VPQMSDPATHKKSALIDIPSVEATKRSRPVDSHAVLAHKCITVLLITKYRAGCAKRAMMAEMLPPVTRFSVAPEPIVELDAYGRCQWKSPAPVDICIVPSI